MAKVSIAIVVLLVCVTSSGARKAKPNLRSGGRPPINPNIIFILTDDMDSELGSPDVMRKTRKILREEGTDFVNAFVTTPMCCPSRSSILTGRYAHNHNTHTNNLNCSSLSWRRGPERKTFARYLQEADYVTGYFGKYLNEYDGSYVPVGYDRWEGLIHNSKFYNYSIRHNTYITRHRANYEKDYFTDLLTNHTIAFIRHVKVTTPNSPFLAVVSHAAPHGPETAAPQYNKAFPGIKAPRFPNWNFYSPDKQWILRETPPMDEQKMAFVDLLHRRRLQTLLSVDDSIERIFSALQAMEIENETYIFFSSDHGYHLGQFGLVKGKSMPYESDIRVPLYVRGPSIPRNVRMKEMVLSIDLAPTFLDIANVRIPKDMDGTSIMKLFKKNRSDRRGKRRTNGVWRDTFLIERSRGWRKKKGFPDKTTGNKTQTKRTRKTTMLEKLCTTPEYVSPCKAGQIWECVTIDNRPRLRKCRRNLTVPATTAAPTSPTSTAKMCVCMKPRPETERIEEQRDAFPDDADDLFPSGYLDHFTKDSTRRSKRSHYYNSRFRRRGKELSARKYYRELARAIKLQNRRAKSKALIVTSAAGPNENNDRSEVPADPPDPYEVPEGVEERLGKLNEKIQGIRMRLEALRDRKKKLLLLSSSDRLMEYPCPCSVGNNTAPAPKTPETVDGGDERYIEQDEEEQDDLFPMKRRKKQSKLASKKAEGKKKKAKTNLRRSKCATRGVNCFYQTNHHWKLPPLWTGGEFCFCPTAANNSYWCLRTINATHNFLYCEFVTDFVEYFDLYRDPYQLYNTVHELSPAVLHQLQRKLNTMKGCKGESCTHYHGKKYASPSTSLPTAPNTPVTPSTGLSVVSDGRFSTTAEPRLVVLNRTAKLQLPTESSGVGKSLEGSAKPSNCTTCTFASPVTSTSAPTEKSLVLERKHTQPPKRRKVKKSKKNPSTKRKSSVESGVFPESNEKDETSRSKTGSEDVDTLSSPLPPFEESSETFANSSDVTNFPISAISTSSPTQPRGKKKRNRNFRDEYLTVKPTGRQKSSKRRERVERHDNISSQKENPKSPKNTKESDPKFGNSSEVEEVTLREMLVQPSKRPTKRRPANRNTKKKLRRKTLKRMKSSRVDEGNPQEGEQPAQNGGGFSYEQDTSDSDP